MSEYGYDEDYVGDVYDDAEARWAEEDQERAAQQADEQREADDERAAYQMFGDACREAGIVDMETAGRAFAYANGLADDEDFVRDHGGPGAEMVRTAIAEGIRFARPPKDEGVMAAAERFVASRAAEGRHQRWLDGEQEPDVVERAVESWRQAGYG